MTSVKEQPKLNLAKSVETWRHAGINYFFRSLTSLGIRFVFFSNEAYDSSIKSFVGRLGLETGYESLSDLIVLGLELLYFP